MIHPDDRDALVEDFNKYLRDEVPYFEAIYRIQTEDDQWMWTLSKGRVVSRDEDGQPLVLAGANKDITALKQTEQAVIAASTITTCVSTN